MLKRMSHPKHGWTHVYTPQEEAFHKNNGWVEELPKVEVKVTEEDAIDDLRDELDSLGVQIDRRWGLKTLQDLLKRTKNANSRRTD